MRCVALVSFHPDSHHRTNRASNNHNHAYHERRAARQMLSLTVQGPAQAINGVAQVGRFAENRG
jgi:hypothetical protein